jgi:hypothetical protein
MTLERERWYKAARRHLAGCRRAMQFLMDVQDDDVAAELLREEFRCLRDALDEFARDQGGIRPAKRRHTQRRTYGRVLQSLTRPP